jgi:hypothetical protein
MRFTTIFPLACVSMGEVKRKEEPFYLSGEKIFGNGKTLDLLFFPASRRIPLSASDLLYPSICEGSLIRSVAGRAEIRFTICVTLDALHSRILVQLSAWGRSALPTEPTRALGPRSSPPSNPHPLDLSFTIEICFLKASAIGRIPKMLALILSSGLQWLAPPLKSPWTFLPSLDALTVSSRIEILLTDVHKNLSSHGDY